MLPLDDIKAPQGKILELGQSQPARGGEEGMGKQPHGRDWSPLPRPESRGNAHPGSEQERKRHVLTGVGLSPTPKEGREPADSFPGLPKVSPFLGKVRKCWERNTLLLFSDFQLRFQNHGLAFP